MSNLQFKCPVPETEIIVTVGCGIKSLAHLPGRIQTFRGFVTPSDDLDEPNTFNMSTGLKHFPERTIPLRLVTAMQDASGAEIKGKVADLVEKFEFEGSKGPYTVTATNRERYKCTCLGFVYHNKCKHVTQVKENQNG